MSKLIYKEQKFFNDDIVYLIKDKVYKATVIDIALHIVNNEYTYSYDIYIHDLEVTERVSDQYIYASLEDMKNHVHKMYHERVAEHVKYETQLRDGLLNKIENAIF